MVFCLQSHVLVTLSAIADIQKSHGRVISMSQRRSFLRFSILAPIWSRCLFACGEQPRSAETELIISGDIPTPLTLKVGDLAKMRRDAVSIPERDGTKGRYEGVPLREGVCAERS